MATKQRKALPFSDKLEIIRRVERGEKKSDVAAAFKIPRSTLSTILKNKRAIYEKDGERPNNSDAKRIRKPAYDEVEKALYQWFLDICARKLPVSGPMLQQKARDFACVFGVENFTAGSGWLHRFKDWYSIVGKTVSGESSAVNVDNVQKWIQDVWRPVAEKYKPCTDETASFWQLLPSRTLALRNKKCHGGKLSKARITILLTANMDGSSKLRPFVIGKTKSPLCFCGCGSLPVIYNSNGKAWMSRVLFEKWLREWDQELALSGRKICLILNNCLAHHCGVSLKHIELCFLPPNVTSVLQPLDQGIIRALKQGYRKRLIERLLVKLRVGEGLKIDLLGAIQMLERAWRDVSADTIANCFRHARLYVDGAESVPVCSTQDDGGIGELWEELASIPDEVPEGVVFDDFLTVDMDVAVTAVPTDPDIAADVTAAAASEGVEECPEAEVPSRPSVQDTLAAMELVRQYCVGIEGSGLEHLNTLSRLENAILNDAANVKNQSKITAYCSKA